ncbi:MAG: GNAT family N-acetyltransferase [Terriglobales bacterium]
MRIRNATRDDIPAMMALAAQAATAGHWRRQDYLDIFSKAVRRLALVVESIDQPHPCTDALPGTSASREHARLCGFIVALCAGPQWEIENIAVISGAQRQGFGTCLLRELLDRARAAGAESVFLEVRASNLPARRLYEKHSFVQTGRRLRYYSAPPEDAITYELRLSPPGPALKPQKP